MYALTLLILGVYVYVLLYYITRVAASSQPRPRLSAEAGGHSAFRISCGMDEAQLRTWVRLSNKRSEASGVWGAQRRVEERGHRCVLALPLATLKHH